jgi:hypothetical protein
VPGQEAEQKQQGQQDPEKQEFEGLVENVHAEVRITGPGAAKCPAGKDGAHVLAWVKLPTG